MISIDFTEQEKRYLMEYLEKVPNGIILCACGEHNTPITEIVNIINGDPANREIQMLIEDLLSSIQWKIKYENK